jgi:hypothetical protein
MKIAHPAHSSVTMKFSGYFVIVLAASAITSAHAQASMFVAAAV